MLSEVITKYERLSPSQAFRDGPFYYQFKLYIFWNNNDK